jgi:hypothetical protein
MSYLPTASKTIPAIARVVICTILIKTAAFIKSSYIVGSQILFFSGTSVAIPLLGAFNSPALCAAICFVRMLFFNSLSLSMLAFIIPGFCAALYWNMNHWSIRLLLPIACFIAFVAHPVGAQAYAYAFYWFIPMALYFVPNKNLFLTALGSTFIAHAVGSTIWIYTVPMTAQMWLGLMPLVAIERLCFATGMVVSYHAVHAATNAASQLYKQLVPSSMKQII